MHTRAQHLITHKRTHPLIHLLSFFHTQCSFGRIKFTEALPRKVFNMNYKHENKHNTYVGSNMRTHIHIYNTHSYVHTNIYIQNNMRIYIHTWHTSSHTHTLHIYTCIQYTQTDKNLHKHKYKHAYFNTHIHTRVCM